MIGKSMLPALADGPGTDPALRALIDHVRSLPADISTRAKVTAIQAELAKMPNHLDLPVEHHFAPGVYLRSLFIPRGVITVSKIHKHACLSILAKGERLTLVDDKIVRVKAPFIQITPPGFKRISYTLEDSVWITVHGTTETDIAKLEHELVCDTEEEYADFCRGITADETKCLS